MKLLILGDVALASTLKLLRMLEAALDDLSPRPECTLKPHPNCMIQSQAFPALRLQITTERLADILPQFDVAYASNSTSAGLDAYLAGLRVVVLLDAQELNMSPLRGERTVRFVSTPVGLARALQSPSEVSSPEDRSRFFFLDAALPRWKRLIADYNRRLEEVS